MWQHLLDLLRAARRPLVVLDFETSGLSGAPPVEFALLVWAPWEATVDDDVTRSAARRCPPGLTYATTMRLDPLRTIDPGAAAVHGIRDADVRGRARRYDDLEVRGLFQAYAAGDASDGTGPAVWCGHNAAGSDVPWAATWGYLPDEPLDLIDTMRTVRRLQKHMPHPPVVDLFPALPCSRMTRVHEDGLDAYASSLVGAHVGLLGVRPEGSHGALADCEATARVLARLLELWAPLWTCASVTSKDPPGSGLPPVLALLDAPPPGQVSWDGWLTPPAAPVTGPLRFAGAGVPPSYVWAKGKYRGRTAHQDAWVLDLPRRPTGDDATPAWCSPRTAEILRGLR